MREFCLPSVYRLVASGLSRLNSASRRLECGPKTALVCAGTAFGTFFGRKSPNHVSAARNRLPCKSRRKTHFSAQAQCLVLPPNVASMQERYFFTKLHACAADLCYYARSSAPVAWVSRLAAGGCWLLLVALGSCWWLLVDAAGGFWRLLAAAGWVAAGSCWRILAVAGGFWLLLAASDGFWWLLVASGGFWRLPVASGCCWRLLAVAGGFWQPDWSPMRTTPEPLLCVKNHILQTVPCEEL